MRKNSRRNNKMRNSTINIGFMTNPIGSCLIGFGNTKVICSATIDDRVPRWMKGKGTGWISAEYSMLPTSTNQRTDRESIRGKQSGRTQEIQRLIGRSIRSVCDLKALGERQIKLDCDVISADGGTRTASITGAWIATKIAIQKLISQKRISTNPLSNKIAAISCGVVDGNVILDLDYIEDSNADVDANFVLSDDNSLVEIQCTGEKSTFSQTQLFEMIELAKSACEELFILQEKSIKEYFSNEKN